jgi:hypothetical protein
MIVMRIAITPSLNAVSRSVLTPSLVALAQFTAAASILNRDVASTGLDACSSLLQF